MTMRFTIDRAILLGLLKQIKPAVTRKSTLPILAYVLFKVVDDLLWLQGTNLEIAITRCHAFDIPAINQNGSLCLPLQHLVKMVEAMPDGLVTIAQIKGRWIAHITASGNECQLDGMDPAEFPAIPTIDHATRFEIDDIDLARLIKRTTFAAAIDDARPVFTGVLFEVDWNNQTITCAAADTFRLAVATAPAYIYSQDCNLEQYFLVPATALNVLATYLPKKLKKGQSAESVGLAFTTNGVKIKYGNLTLYSHLIEGKFPNWRAIVPKSAASHIIMDTQALRRITKGMLLEKANGMTWYVTGTAETTDTPQYDEAYLTFEAEYDGIGWMKQRLPVAIAGPDTQMIFNPNFLIDYLASVTTESVLFKANSPLSPLIILPYDDGSQIADETFTYVGMPLYAYEDKRSVDYRVALTEAIDEDDQKERAPIHVYESVMDQVAVEEDLVPASLVS